MQQRCRMLLASIFLLCAAFAGAATYPLYAGRNILIGTIDVTNDATNLVVTYNITVGDWVMTETHLHISTTTTGFPMSNGNVAPGQFDHSTMHDPAVTTYKYTIPNTWGTGTIYIAAHAKVESHQDTLNVYSRPGADVKIIEADGLAITPTPAVDTWVHGSWNASLTPSPGTKLDLASWIWESYKVLNPLANRYLKFQQQFTVPGVPIGTPKLTIAADNFYTANLNGSLVGERWIGNAAGDINLAGTWIELGSYDFPIVQGLNTLTIDVRNWWSSDYPDWTDEMNPAGLRYQVAIDYLRDRFDTAWPTGTRFGGKNWATYISYTLAP